VTIDRPGNPESSENSLLRDRSVRLFKFLRELALLKSKTLLDLSGYEEIVWFHQIPPGKGCFTILDQTAENADDMTWLEIKQPPEPAKPAFPDSCLKWVEKEINGEDLYLEPILKEKIGVIPNTPENDPSFPVSEKSENLADHPEISREWAQWKQEKWEPWTKEHCQWSEIAKKYLQLFLIHQQLKRLGERYELVLGLGLLTWLTPNNRIIRRHIITGDAQLLFDAFRAQFEVQPAPEGVKLHLETDMIEQGYLPPLDQLKEIEVLLDSSRESPWDKAGIEKILKSFIYSLSAQGIYSDSIRPPDDVGKEPVVTFAPAIILRTRTQRSQVQCLEKIIEEVSGGGAIPSGIKILCREPDNGEGIIEEKEDGGKPVEGGALYLPLPTNEEQEQIVCKIRRNTSVLVQGPPGTGKSHTIANIVCHLLAEGKRVLVTSQTPRALKVLKEKIPGETRALCVTLLGNDQTARKELENSVGEINRRYSGWDQVRSRKLIAELEEKQLRTRKEKAEKERLLREQREINTYQHEILQGAYRGTAQQIARRIAEEESRFSWLEDNIENEQACPISFLEMQELLRLYRRMPPEYCLDLKKELVSRDSLPDVAHFLEIINNEKKTLREMEKLELRRNSLRYHILRQIPEDSLFALHKAVSALMTARGSINKRFNWVEQAILEVLGGNDTPWNNLCELLNKYMDGLEQKVNVAQTLEIQISGNPDRRKLKTDASDLLKHLNSGGGMGWMFMAAKVVRQSRYITDEVKVNGQLCNTPDKLQMLITYLEAADELDLLWSAFQGKDRREDVSQVLQVGYLRERQEALTEILDLKTHLAGIKDSLKTAAGLVEPQWHRPEEIEEMLLDIEAAGTEIALTRVRTALEVTLQKIRAVQSKPAAHALNGAFVTALEQRDAHLWAGCLAELESIEQGRMALSRRDMLADRLKSAAPQLEKDLENTCCEKYWDARAANLESAWSWRLADKWLKNFGREHDEDELEISLARCTAEEQLLTSQLAAEKAWDNCLRKLTPFQRANLNAWAKAMQRMPRTLTAITRPRWLKQAQEAMDNCRGAIPAWIMPLHRVFETITPSPECFDVVIVDEASQTGPEGLVLQYLAKQCIIVGDDQQINPEAIGELQENIDTLGKRYLEGIPFQGFYVPQTSIFDFAGLLFHDKIVLREHFRCMPEIIQFSNQLCYSGTPLKPLRQYPADRLDPVVLRQVKEGYRQGSANNVVNPPEAEAVVESIVEMCSSQKYTGKSIGVISLQGEAQARLIENRLLTRLSPSELEARKIICGDAYAFQGDERDIMVLSLVAAPNERIGPLVKESDKRRFNVAASRAKDQVILFHSVTLNDLNPECMRYKLLDYYLNPSKQAEEVDLGKCESGFEQDVCQAMIDRGYSVIPQFKVAEYRIDLVVEGTECRLAVECDGDEFHGAEFYTRDMARQRILERCGWRFWRIRGHEYYRYPAIALEPLWELLSEMGIQPVSEMKKS
jgi:very-short-patch-repair endonuclease